MHALGIPTGHANIDFILDADGPKIIEIGARLGATCMPESFNVLTGADLFAEAIALALGEKPPPIRPAGQPNAARYITAPRPGVLRSIRVPEQTAEASDVVRLTLYAAPGDEVRPFQCASDRIGEVIVTAPTAADAGRRAEEIAGAIEMTFEQEPQP
jgi:biotin carboxylase